MDHFLLWDTVSMAWTEIALDPPEYPPIARELRASYGTWREANKVILVDVVGSFAIESALLPLAFVPLLGIFVAAFFPDWGYDETYLRRRMTRWYSVPRGWHYVNPLRLFGYPLAYLFSLPVRCKLKAAYHAVPS